MKHLKVGDKAPNFITTDQDGNRIELAQHLGEKVVLFFYPKDDSPSCTKEACSIRDNYKKLVQEGLVVYGVSPDTEKKHRKFIDKFELQYPLLADTEKEIIESFGLWGEKKFMGKIIVGVYRTTIIIDEKGYISHIIDKVKTSEHAEQILNLIHEKN